MWSNHTWHVNVVYVATREKCSGRLDLSRPSLTRIPRNSKSVTCVPNYHYGTCNTSQSRSKVGPNKAWKRARKPWTRRQSGRAIDGGIAPFFHEDGTIFPGRKATKAQISTGRPVIGPRSCTCPVHVVSHGGIAIKVGVATPHARKHTLMPAHAQAHVSNGMSPSILFPSPSLLSGWMLVITRARVMR